VGKNRTKIEKMRTFLIFLACTVALAAAAPKICSDGSDPECKCKSDSSKDCYPNPEEKGKARGKLQCEGRRDRDLVCPDGKSPVKVEKKKGEKAQAPKAPLLICPVKGEEVNCACPSEDDEEPEDCTPWLSGKLIGGEDEPQAEKPPCKFEEFELTCGDTDVEPTMTAFNKVACRGEGAEGERAECTCRDDEDEDEEEGAEDVEPVQCFNAKGKAPNCLPTKWELECEEGRPHNPFLPKRPRNAPRPNGDE